MLFVLNGKPSRIYRALLNPMRMKTFDALLEEVSQGLQVSSVFVLLTHVSIDSFERISPWQLCKSFRKVFSLLLRRILWLWNKICKIGLRCSLLFQIAIFKIYTYAGRRVLSVDELMSMNEARVLAVPRHERPHLKRHAAVPRATSLPPIPQEKVSKSTSATTSSRKLSSGMMLLHWRVFQMIAYWVIHLVDLLHSIIFIRNSFVSIGILEANG